VELRSGLGAICFLIRMASPPTLTELAITASFTTSIPRGSIGAPRFANTQMVQRPGTAGSESILVLWARAYDSYASADGSAGATTCTAKYSMPGTRSRPVGHGPPRTALSRTGNAVGGQPSRGFESHPLRHLAIL
jgi:hypothetical protein